MPPKKKPTPPPPSSDSEGAPPPAKKIKGIKIKGKGGDKGGDKETDLQVASKKVMSTVDEKFGAIVGQKVVKDQVQHFAIQSVYKKHRTIKGIKGNGATGGVMPHMAFLGSPGTGKTSMARIIASLAYILGIVSTTRFYSAKKGELKGQYVGQTGKLTKKFLDKCEGGVAVLDEFGELDPRRCQYDMELLNTLMSVMERVDVNAPMLIFMGYTKPVLEVLSVNPGMARRVQYTFVFEDYTDLELARILRVMCKGENYVLEKTDEEIARLFHETFEVETKKQQNCGICHKVFRAIVSSRLDGMLPTDVVKMDAKQLTTFTSREIENGFAAANKAEQFHELCERFGVGAP